MCGGAMSFLIYLVVAIVTALSVLFEMDVLVVSLPHVLPPAHTASAPAQLQHKPAATTHARALAPAAELQAAAPPAQAPQSAAASNKCDVTACAAAYQSFRVSDCTYEPQPGVRQLCTKGVVSSEAAAQAALDAHADANAGPAASTKCNVDACSAAYVSFNAADCTYQPYDGPRRLCTK
jgi:hypothetical protein